MTSHQPKQWPLFTRLIPVLILLFLMAIYNSCKKNDFTESSLPVSNPVINEAKSWYETTYPVNIINKPLQVNNSGVETDPDLSQKIKPDWVRNSTYRRLGKDVIEIPIDASTKFKSGLKNSLTNTVVGNINYSKSSFLLLKDNGKYDAYIMTIVADSAYIKNDISKLSRNTYSKRDSNFSGQVIYFTPKGKYVSSWLYKNGHIVTNASPSGAANNNETQGVGNKLKPMTNEPVTCVHWFWVRAYEDGEIISISYMYSICTGNTGPGSGNPSPPPPCPQSKAKVAINGNAPPSDDDPIGEWGDGNDPGFPPPTSNTTCTVSVPPDATNPPEAVKPCALKFKNITSNWMAVAVSGYKFGIHDNVFGTKFITFNVQIGMPSYVSTQQAQSASAAAMLVAEAYIAQTHGTDFFLSAGAQVKYSREFASIVQSELAVVLGLPGVQVQNAITPGVPIITYADNNCN